MRIILGMIAVTMLMAGAASAETRALSGFNAVDASGRIEVEIAIGPHFSVELTGPRVENVITRISGERLEIEPRRSQRRGPGRDAMIRITMPDIRALEVSAGAEARARDVRADSFRLGASSGASADISGSCRTLSMDMSSGASVRAGGFQCDEVRVDASSGASGAVFARNAISVDASSGASVRWAGGAAIRRFDLSSGGSARRTD